MKRLTRSIALCFFVWICASNATADETALTLCAKTEEALFSCRLSNKKTVSLCTPAGKVNEENSFIRYRYGTAGTKPKIELSLTAEKGTAHKSVSQGYAPHQRAAFLRFSNSSTYTYVPYSTVESTSIGNAPAIKGGLAVVRRNSFAIVSNKKCVGELVGEIRLEAAEIEILRIPMDAFSPDLLGKR